MAKKQAPTPPAADGGGPRSAQVCELELELVEPSVFIEHADGAAKRFTLAILQRARTS